MNNNLLRNLIKLNWLKIWLKKNHKNQKIIVYL